MDGWMGYAMLFIRREGREEGMEGVRIGYGKWNEAGSTSRASSGDGESEYVRMHAFFNFAMSISI